MEASRATSVSPPLLDPHARAPFRHILCAVDGSPSALEGVRQAAALAGPETTIDLVAVCDGSGDGQTAWTPLPCERAERYIHEARRVLDGTVANVTTRAAHGYPAWRQLLEEAEGCDLVVVGRHGASRALAITFGSTASSVIHHAHRSVLVAVAPPPGRGFPGRILVAAGGPGHPEVAVRMAGRIARHTGTDEITLLRVDWARRARPQALADGIAQVRETSGIEPDEIIVGGSPHRAIPEFAAREEASLAVLGTRGLGGVRALRSVSERVAHHAPCSVLIVQGPSDRS
jgi:nucleotide-binding universal stress UspA family protein